MLFQEMEMVQSAFYVENSASVQSELSQEVIDLQKILDFTASEVNLMDQQFNNFKQQAKYPCKFCHKCFPTPDKLQRHQLVHSGEKPYLCFICLKGFTQRVHLNTHKKHSHPGQEGVEGGEGDADMDTEGSEEGSLAIAEH